jgi:hypothetical protein
MYLLKGTVSQDFRPQVFYQRIPSGPLIHGLKLILLWLRICEVIWQSWCLGDVIDTAEAPWAVSMTPLRPPERIQLCELGSKSLGLRVSRLSGVSMTPQWHRLGCLSGVNDTAMATSAVSMTPLRCYNTAEAKEPRIREAAFKGNINKKIT